MLVTFLISGNSCRSGFYLVNNYFECKRYVEIGTDRSLVVVATELMLLHEKLVDQNAILHCFISRKQLVANSIPTDDSESVLKKIMKIQNTIKIWSLTIHFYSVHFKK